MNVDAAYAPDTGLAGIAYVGSMGESSRVVVCDSSVEAELRAMVMAMDAASERGLERITFRTDCQSVGHPYGRRGGPKVMDLRQQIRDHLGAHLSWRLTQVPRRANAAANAHARKALRRAQGWPR
jgi:ribonuclease HI